MFYSLKIDNLAGEIRDNPHSKGNDEKKAILAVYIKEEKEMKKRLSKIEPKIANDSDSVVEKESVKKYLTAMPEDNSQLNSNPLNLKNMEKEKYIPSVDSKEWDDLMAQRNAEKVAQKDFVEARRAYSELNKPEDAGLDYFGVNKQEEDEIKIKENKLDEEIKAETGESFSPELKQEFLEKNEEFINKKAKNEDEQNISKHIKVIDKNIALETENAELKEKLKSLENILTAKNSEIDKQIEQEKNPTLKETIKEYWKDPKVKGIVAGALIGVGLYAASGGTAPVYFFCRRETWYY